MKTLEEFLAFAETFPSSLAATLGKGWKYEDVIALAAEIRRIANLPAASGPIPSLGANEPPLKP